MAHASSSFKIETRGIEAVPDSERHGHVRSQFFNCWARNFHLPPLFAGAAGVVLGLGFVWTLIAIVLATALGSAANSLCVVMGPRRGCPQMVTGRAAYGYFGNYFPSVAHSILFLGFFIVNAVLGAKAVEALWPVVPLPLLVISIGIISIVLGIFGYDLLQTYSAWTTTVTAIIFVVLLFIGMAHGFGSTMHGHLHGSQLLDTWLLQFTASFALISSWGSYGSDLSRYLPENTSESSVFWATWIGMFISSAFVMALGALFATVAPVGGVLEGIRQGSGNFAYIALLAMLPGAVSSTVINLYSGALSTQSWDLKIDRRWLVGGIGVLGTIAGSIWGGPQFFGYFLDFLDVVSFIVTPWLVIVCLMFYKTYDHGRRLPTADKFYSPQGIGRFNWTGVSALLVGIGVSVPFMATSFYIGPVARQLGGADLAYFVSAAAAAVIYLVRTTLFRKESPRPLVQSSISAETRTSK